jgi:hypothetical protein
MGSICLPYATHAGELTFHRNCKRVAREEIAIAASKRVDLDVCVILAL